MTAAMSNQTITVKDPSAARKRRRRAPTGGASDDCFTCAKRGVKCDRRRPYCSQCLEVGNECSGYKTQLTWGVGVASRGKLRGLSLPVAKSPPVAREPKKTSPRVRASSNASSASSGAARWIEQDESRRVPRSAIDVSPVSQPTSGAATPYGAPSYDYLAISHPEHSMHHHAHQQQHQWHQMQQYSSGTMAHHAETPHKFSRFGGFPTIITDGLSNSMDSPEVDYMSPMSQPYHREEMPFVGSPTMMYDGYHSAHSSSPVPPSPPTSVMMDNSRAPPTSCPGLVYTPSEAGSSLTSQLDPFETHFGQRLMRDHLSEQHMMPVTAYSF